MRSLANGKQIFIKEADKGSCMVVWDRDDYQFKAGRQLKDEINWSVTCNEKLIEDVTECSNKIFKNLRRWGHLSKKQLNRSVEGTASSTKRYLI